MTVKASDFNYKLADNVDQAVQNVAFNLISGIMDETDGKCSEYLLAVIEGILELANQIHNIIENDEEE